MSENSLDKLKKNFLTKAQSSAVKLEDAARSGKIHLDILTQNRKLSKEYQELGLEAYMSLQEGTIAKFAERPMIPEIQERIAIIKQTIAELEERLGELKVKGERDKPEIIPEEPVAG